MTQILVADWLLMGQTNPIGTSDPIGTPYITTSVQSWSVLLLTTYRLIVYTTTLPIVYGYIHYTVFNTRARREWLGTGNAPSPGGEPWPEEFSSGRVHYTGATTSPTKFTC